MTSLTALSFCGTMPAASHSRGAQLHAYLEYGIYRTMGGILGRLPPSIGYPAASKLGAVLYALSPGLRDTLSDNISHVLGRDAGDERVEELVRLACVHYAKTHYDLFRVSRLSPDELKQMIRIEGREQIDRARERGKGVIMISAHMGNIDVVGQVAPAYGVPITGPVQHIQPERLFQFVLKLRQRHGLRLIPSDGPLIELYRALRRNELVGLPCDRGIADSARETDFFGSPARLPDGPVRLALRTGAALIPGFVLRLPDNSYRLTLEPELELHRGSDTEADVDAGMDQVVAVMERYIARNPEQWLVAVRVWDTNHEQPVTD
ncbi:lysophospholipid acyltransferase family protein [Chloroflexota bacterium]